MNIPIEWFQLLVTVAFGFVGWIGNELWNFVKRMHETVAKLQTDLPKDYVQKDDYKQDIGRVHELLDKIYDKLEGKADKTK